MCNKADLRRTLEHIREHEFTVFIAELILSFSRKITRDLNNLEGWC